MSKEKDHEIFEEFMYSIPAEKLTADEQPLKMQRTLERLVSVFDHILKDRIRYVITLPGCKKEDISVEALNEKIIITAPYSICVNPECPLEGKFEIGLRLRPNSDYENVSAVYDGGILTVEVPFRIKELKTIKVQ